MMLIMIHHVYLYCARGKYTLKIVYTKTISTNQIVSPVYNIIISAVCIFTFLLDFIGFYVYY